MSEFDPSKAVAVNQTSQGNTPADTGSFNVDQAVPVNESNNGNTDWENFKNDSNAPEVSDATSDSADKVGKPSSVAATSEAPLNSNKQPSTQDSRETNNLPDISNKGRGDVQGSPTSSPKPYKTVIGPKQWPIAEHLNSMYLQGMGDVWETYERPFASDKTKRFSDEALADLNRQHPVQSVVAGYAPFLTVMPFVPETLVPKLYMRLASQFGLVGLGEGVNRAEEDKSKQFMDKTSDVAQETLKQMGYSIPFSLAAPLKLLQAPYYHALLRAGVNAVGRSGIIGGGTGIMSMVYGDNLTEAVKQGGMYAGLNLITESPHLAGTVIGRGLINHTNSIYADMAVKAGLPQITIDPNSPDVAKQVHDVAANMAKQIPGIDKPQIVAAAIKINKSESNVRRVGRVVDHGDGLKSVILTDAQIKKLGATRKLGGAAIDGNSLIESWKAGISDFNAEAAGIKPGDKVIIVNDEHAADIDNIIKHEKGHHDFESWSDEDKSNFNKNAKKIIDDKDHNLQDVIKGLKEDGYSDDKIAEELYVRGFIDKEGNEIKGANKSQIAPPDSEPMTGADHEDILNRIGRTEKNKSDYQKSVDGKDHQAGFMVLQPNGKIDFITRQESMKEPFNLPTGHSNEVKGLNESKFMPQEDPIKIVNPDTLDRIKNNEGKMDANLIPFKAEIAENLKRSYEETVKTFVAPDVSDPSKFTAMSMRQWLGLNARNEDRFMDAMRNARNIFEKMSKDDIIKTYTKAQRGEKQDDPHLQKIYDVLQKSLLDLAHVVQAETGRLQELIDNYLPQAWEDPKKAQNAFRRIMGKRPLGGPKSFLKKRSINDFEEGTSRGLVPISWNPVDLTMFKLREMNRFLMENRVRKALRGRGFEYFLRVGAERKPGTDDWVKIKDSGSDVYKSPMIAIQEAYDEHVMTKLNNVASSLGIDVERLVKMRGGKSWGSSHRGLDDWPQEGELLKGQAQPGKIKTKFAGPTSVLAHEIGHQIDEMKSGKDRFIPEYTNMILDQKIKALEKNEAMTDDERKDAIKKLKFSKKRNDELNALADLRYEGKPDVTDSFKKYVRKGSEKMAVMLEAYIHAPNKFKEAAPELFKRFDEFIQSKPELKPLSEIEPSLVLGTNKAEIYAGGNVIAGHWLTHPDAARIVDNYLSPGLRGDYFYDIWRSAGNSLIQARLSLSAFHSQFVSNDANISHFALGLNKLASGDINGFKNIALSALGPIPVINPGALQTFSEGRKMMESWNGKDNGPIDNMIAELYARGGGRAKMDKFWAIESDKAMAKAMKEGKYMTGVLHTPFWILQQMNRPLLEYYVPRMKMGVFANLMKFELEKNPNISQEQLLGKAQKAVDAVDDRMGQLVYDNLFLNKTLKDIGMGSVQSFGWNVGDVRLFGGGSIDLMKNLNDLRQGKGTELGYRLAYVLAMPMVMGWYGAIYQYLHTGKYPGQGIENEGMAGILKDLYFPRNGGFDPRGQQSRSSLASYVRDIYHFAQDPVRTVIDKLNPLGSEVLNQYQNKNFYGVKIYNEDDGLVQQLIDRLSDGVASNLPYSFQNAQRNPVKGIEPKIENFFGYGIAPYDINMTSAEKESYSLGVGNMSPASRTKDQAQHSQAISQLRSQYLANKDEGPLTAAVDQKLISPREKREIIKDAKKSNLQRLTKDLTFEQTFHILNKGDPTEAEKKDLEQILEKKKGNKENRGTWTNAEEALYDRAVAMAQ